MPAITNITSDQKDGSRLRARQNPIFVVDVSIYYYLIEYLVDFQKLCCHALMGQPSTS